MSFVFSQYVRPNNEGGGCVYFREPVEGKDGKEDYALVNQAKELPPMSAFRLKNQLEAGVNLERVDTKMFSPRELDLNAFEQPKGEEKTKQEQTKQEQIKQEQTKQEQTNNGDN